MGRYETDIIHSNIFQSYVTVHTIYVSFLLNSIKKNHITSLILNYTSISFSRKNGRLKE